MDRIVDLDAVREELDCRRPSWQQAGLVVGDLTWRDDSPGTPAPLVTDSRATHALGPALMRIDDVRGRGVPHAGSRRRRTPFLRGRQHPAAGQRRR